MRSFTYMLFMLSVLRAFASDPQTHMPMVKVYQNDLEKIYTVFFADTLERTVNVGLIDKNGTVLMEESFTGKGFSKPYGLSELRNGKYEFVISFDDQKINKSVNLRNPKKVLEESITVSTDYPEMFINVTKYNMKPMNIFIYDSYDKLLKMHYWEPNENNMKKKFDMSVYDAFEVRVQIVQDGEDQLEQLVQLY